MKTEFCSACGHKIEYNFAPPNFCSKCGEPMAGGAKPSRAESQEVARAAASQVVEEEQVPQISSLQYDIDYDRASPSVKFETLAMQKVDTDDASLQRRKGRRGQKQTGPQLSREEFLVKSVKECKSVGNTSREIGGEEKKK